MAIPAVLIGAIGASTGRSIMKIPTIPPFNIPIIESKYKADHTIQSLDAKRKGGGVTLPGRSKILLVGSC